MYWIVGLSCFILLTGASEYRLPSNVYPTNYAVRIDTAIEQFDPTDQKTFKFNGNINITLRASEDNVSSIELNAYVIDIISSKLIRKDDGKEIALNSSIPEAVSYQKIVYELKTGSLNVETDYVLNINYVGHHTDQGLYSSFYDNKNGERKYLLVTQFEAMYARKAFPCFDEPVFKAKWNITVAVSRTLENYTAVANTPLADDPVIDPQNSSLLLFIFKETPVPISSYLIAIAVSDFKTTSPAYFTSDYQNQTGRKEFQTIGRSDYIDGFAATSQLIGPQFLEYMTGRLNIGYGFEKMDLIGVPSLSFGAMENWGLVTFRDYLLLVNPEDEDDVKSCTSVICHELTHQWFGNLVTLHWWEDAWLNEGFATYFEYFGTDQLRNNSLDIESWNLPGSFVVEEQQDGAFFVDGYDDSDPLTGIVNTAEEGDDIFSTISYSKGGSIIRMFSLILGEEIFYDGLHRYLQARQQNVGTPDYLSSAFQEAVDLAGENATHLGKNTVKEIYDSYRTVPGYPVLQVSSLPLGVVSLRQERFLTYTSGEVPDTKWYIPITFTVEGVKDYSTSPMLWLTPSDENLPVFVGTNISWYIFNNLESGYYRVNYNTQNWAALTKVLANISTYQDIPVLNRAQLVDDSLSLAEGGYIDFAIALRLTNYLEHEDDPLPLQAYNNHVGKFRSRLVNDIELYQAFDNHIIRLFSKQFEQLGFEPLTGENYRTKQRRKLVISMMCAASHEGCIKMAAKLFAEDIDVLLTTGKSMIDSTVRPIVYCYGVRNGSPELWSNLVIAYKKSKSPGQKKMILNALACNREEEHLKELFHILIKNNFSETDSKDILKIIVNTNPDKTNFVLKFIRNNLKDLKGQIGKFLGSISRFIAMTYDLDTVADIQGILSSSYKSEYRQQLKSIQHALTVIHSNIKIAEKYWVTWKKLLCISEIYSQKHLKS